MVKRFCLDVSYRVLYDKLKERNTLGRVRAGPGEPRLLVSSF